MMLAGTLKDQEVRKTLKLEALKQFDGDYDILYKNFANRSFTDGKKFKDKLAPFGSGKDARTWTETAERLNLIVDAFPIMGFSVDPQ